MRREVGPEQKEGMRPGGSECPRVGPALEMPGPLVGSIHCQQRAAVWEPGWYNLKLPRLYLSGPPRSSLLSGQHLLWATDRTLPIGHPGRGQPPPCSVSSIPIQLKKAEPP